MRMTKYNVNGIIFNLLEVRDKDRGHFSLLLL
jgi:hypothetical protein